jgi:hypothetical protein
MAYSGEESGLLIDPTASALDYQIPKQIVTYLVTSWSRVLENLTSLQLVKKCPAFY